MDKEMRREQPTQPERGEIPFGTSWRSISQVKLKIIKSSNPELGGMNEPFLNVITDKELGEELDSLTERVTKAGATMIPFQLDVQHKAAYLPYDGAHHMETTEYICPTTIFIIQRPSPTQSE